MADYTLSRIAGNVGSDPTFRDTSKGKVLVFSVAQPVKFGKDAPDPEWYNVAVWDHGMQQVVQKNIRKGDRVVVVGPRKPDRPAENGKVYRDITGYRIGKVDYLFPLDSAPGQPVNQTPSDQAEDDLPF